MTSLPPLFVERIRARLGDEADAYFEAMKQPPKRGLRVNPLKPTDVPLSQLTDGVGNAVPWEPNGFYLSLESDAGALPLHEAGAYYLQEPSAMTAAALLNAQPNEIVLDLCAAPGGKSTQLAASMRGQGLLVCNEPVPSRAQILSRNLERMGVTNALVVSSDPSRLETAWPQLFDAILVDAPCSGEGMFRRHPETCAEWNEQSPAMCAQRQRRILESALKMLRVGGRMVYSTCTLNHEENDEQIAALLLEHPELEAVAFELSAANGRTLSSTNGGLHLFPHQVDGEGHFVAQLRKTSLGRHEESSPCTLIAPQAALGAPSKALLEAYRCFAEGQASCATDACGSIPTGNAVFGDTLLCAPELPPVKGIRVLRAGLTLGACKGKIFAPDHALAMAAPRIAFAAVPLDDAQARRYQRGETLEAPCGLKGFATVELHGLALGFVKASDGQLKNHYPKGLRR